MRTFVAEERLNLIGSLAFGLGNGKKAKDAAEKATAGEQPERSGIGEPLLQSVKGERDDKGQEPVDERGDRSGRSFDFLRHDLSHHEPRQRSHADGESGDEDDQRRQRQPSQEQRRFLVVLLDVEERAQCQQGDDHDNFRDHQQSAPA